MKPRRWYVRPEAVRTPRFGETRRDVTMWAAFVYSARDAAGNPIPTNRAVYFASHLAALGYARRNAKGIA